MISYVPSGSRVRFFGPALNPACQNDTERIRLDRHEPAWFSTLERFGH